MKRLVVLAASTSLLVGATGPTWAAADESAPAPATVGSPAPSTSPTAEAAAAPPRLASATATIDAVTVAWTWGDAGLAPTEVTSVLVRVTPGGHEARVPRDDLTATIDGLDAETDYSVTVAAVVGDVIGEPSAPLEVTTLAPVDTGSDVVDDAAIKPLATPGEVTSLIVTLKAATDAVPETEAATSDLPVAGVEVTETVDLGAGNALVELTAGVSDADAALMIAEIEADPAVASVEVNGRVQRTAFPNDPPDDPYWTSNALWGLYGTYGIAIGSSRTSMNSIWTSGQGDGVVVAVIDSGSTAHPDLDDNYVAGYDFVSDGSPSCRPGATSSDGDYVSTGTYGALGWDSNPLDPGDWTTVNTQACNYASNSSWHGTHVAGTVAAVGNNGIGVIGVAPKARIQPVRALSLDGGTYADLTAAITWASGGTVAGVPANATPADVINMSLGGASATCPSSLQSAITDAVSRGSVVVVSAGNENQDASLSTPANCTGVITVASTDSAGNRSSFSNYGSTVEIAAPGSGIWSTMNTGTTLPASATYTSYSGTSMAAPHVSGIAALIKLAYPALTPAQVLTRIQSNVTAFPGASTCTTSICGSGITSADAGATTAPVVTGVSPTAGPSAGGTSTTISGYNLDGASLAVQFGSQPVTSPTASSAYAISATSPAGSAGSTSVTVSTSAGSRTLASAFTYVDPPTLSQISPTTGTTAGGTSVTLTGTNLSGTTTVTFDGVAAAVTSRSGTTVSVTTPAHAAGAVDVEVTTLGGSAALAGAFTYTAPPAPAPAPPSGGGSSSSSSDSGGGGGALQTITEVRPAFGPLSGGNLVAIIGYGFTGATSVTIGGKAATFRVINDATVEVTMPPGDALGSVDVAVNLTAARGRAFAPGGYVYVADTPVTTPPPATAPPVVGAPSSSAGGAEFITFRANSAVLTPATRAKLARLAAKVAGTTAAGVVTTFSDLRGSASSIRVAKARAQNITRYLASQGVTGPITTTVDEGSTSTLRRGAVVRLSPDTKASTVTPSDRVNSLIVRYRKGVSPTIDGKVRGASLVTGGLGSRMTLGPNLGLRMYRVDFAAPVTLVQAERAATQMMRDRGIEFAEPDGIVRATVRVS